MAIRMKLLGGPRDGELMDDDRPVPPPYVACGVELLKNGGLALDHEINLYEHSGTENGVAIYRHVRTTSADEFWAWAETQDMKETTDEKRR